jgi:Protein of unknown function (DUF2961)
MSLRNLSLLSAAQTRSICAENFDESKGRGGMATEGTGRSSRAGTRPGMEGVAEHRHSRARHGGFGRDSRPWCDQHIWMTIHPDKRRRLVIRIFWDGEEHPSVEVPLGDFFCNGWVHIWTGAQQQPASKDVSAIALNASFGYWNAAERSWII